MMKLLAGILLLCLFACDANCQIAGDTLKGAEVHGLSIGGGSPKGRYEAGMKTIGIDSLAKQPYLHENLATLLSGVTTAFVRSYGYNSFATLSFRGASAAQSAVYWEGIPLMNGATGLTDVSLLPVSLLDSISINYGGSAALYGSGNVGGAVMLREAKPFFTDGFEEKVRTDVNAASFDHYTGSGIFEVTSRKIYVGAGIEGMRAAGNFPAYDEQGNRFITENAGQFRQNIKAALAWNAGSGHLLSAHYWLGHYDRQIPRALFESRSEKTQHDSEQRLVLQWQHSANSTRLYAKAAWLSNRFGYEDSAIGLYSYQRSEQLFWEGGWEGRIARRGRLLLFAPVQYFFQRNTPARHAQTRIALASAYTQTLLRERLQLALHFRLESFDGKPIAMPGISAAYSMQSAFRIRANVQRSYRAPTLNELFYSPGGNADLKPEQGWSFEAGYDFHKNRNRNAGFSHSLTAYNRYVQDWIIWLGGAVWTPHNLAAVYSRGLETENALSGKWNHGTWRIGVNAAYVRSTTAESYLPGDNSIGRQIPYVPHLTATGLAGISWRAFYFEWHTTYTGLRYVTSDESESLPAYCLGNFRMQYRLGYKDWNFRFYGAANNIWNQQYQVVAYRPMPGINWNLGLSIYLSED